MITVSTKINATVEKIWDYWSNPKHIANWTFATSDWHVPFVENDLQINGKFITRMEAKDGSFGFDFEGIYSNIIEYQFIEYHIIDGRKVSIQFIQNQDFVEIIESFDPENENTLELQQQGWQSILDNFKKYVEEN